eukprot:2080058-Pleurochrysis_carterae.AAC.2
MHECARERARVHAWCARVTSARGVQVTCVRVRARARACACMRVRVRVRVRMCACTPFRGRPYQGARRPIRSRASCPCARRPSAPDAVGVGQHIRGSSKIGRFWRKIGFREKWIGRMGCWAKPWRETSADATE